MSNFWGAVHAGLPFFYIFVPGVKFVPYGIQVFSPSCRVARPGVGVGGLCRFPAGGVGVRSAHAARFGLVAAGRRHGFAFPDPCGRRGAARLRVVGLGRPEPLRVVARPLVCRAVVLHFVALLMLLFSGYDPHLYGDTEMFIRGIARNVVWGALWFLFLLYLERSRALDAAMSGERRNLPLWCVALMVVVLAMTM